MSVAERNTQLTADLTAARERGLQAQERVAGLEAALRERDAAAEAEQLLRCRVRLCNGAGARDPLAHISAFRVYNAARPYSRHALPGCALLRGPCRMLWAENNIGPPSTDFREELLSPVQSEQTMAEQEARLQQAQEQLQEVRASEAQLQWAPEASMVESAATIAVLKATMESASTEALELEQRRHVSTGHELRVTSSLWSAPPVNGLDFQEAQAHATVQKQAMGNGNHCLLLGGGMRSMSFSMWSRGVLDDSCARLQAKGGGGHAE